MTANLEFRHRWVLVTGASSGLGEEMARQLAREHGANLILVARRQEKLEALRQELAGYGVQCRVIAADLSKPDDVERVFEESTAQQIHGVILNAGITYFGRHLGMDQGVWESMLATNVTSTVRLVNLFVPWLLEQGQGGAVMLVASMAGLVPVPFQSAYAGTKAFLVNFGQSLAQELRDEDVSLTVFAPGGISTPLTLDSGLRYFENSPFLQDVQSCARDGLTAMHTRADLYVPGLLNRSQLLLARLAPRKLIASITRLAYGRALAATGNASGKQG